MTNEMIDTQLAAIMVIFFCTITIIYLLVKRKHLKKDQQSMNQAEYFFSSPNQNELDLIFEEIESAPLSQSTIANVLKDIQKIWTRNGSLNAMVSNFHNIYISNLAWSPFLIALIFVLSILGNFLPGIIAVIILATFHYSLSQKYKQFYSQIHRFTITTLVPCFSQEPPEKQLSDVSNTLTIISQIMDQKFKELTDKILINQSSYTKLSDNLYATIVSIESVQHQLSDSHHQIQVNLKKFNEISGYILQQQRDSQQIFENISQKIDMNKEDLSELYKQLKLYYKNLSLSFKQTITETAGIIRSASKTQDQKIQKLQKKYALIAKKKANSNDTTK